MIPLSSNNCFNESAFRKKSLKLFRSFLQLGPRSCLVARWTSCEILKNQTCELKPELILLILDHFISGKTHQSIFDWLWSILIRDVLTLDVSSENRSHINCICVDQNLSNEPRYIKSLVKKRSKGAPPVGLWFFKKQSKPRCNQISR